jgi:hypothetical protein
MGPNEQLSREREGTEGFNHVFIRELPQPDSYQKPGQGAGAQNGEQPYPESVQGEESD